MIDYEFCQDCIQKYGGTTQVSLANYTEPDFAPYVDFCQAQVPQGSPSQSKRTTSISSSSISSTSASIPNKPSPIPVANQQPTTISNPPNTIPKNHNWIAGAVLEPIIILLLVVAAIFLIRRQKKETLDSIKNIDEVDSFGGKAQLHGDSLIVYEFATDTSRIDMSEMDAREPTGKESAGKTVGPKMEARESVGRELPGMGSGGDGSVEV